MSESFGLIKGLKVTFKELFRKSVTDKYPKEFRKKPQRFHYIRGKKISFNLKKELSDLGYKIKETIVYDQVLNKLSADQKKLIIDGKVLGTVFFSASVAKHFCDNLKKVSDGFLFFCISDRVANIITSSDTEGKYIVKVAKKPTQDGIIDLICKKDILY